MGRFKFPPVLYVILVATVLFIAAFKTGGLEAYIGNRNIQPGDTGADVLEMQQRLGQFGYFRGRPTGIYDKKTLEGVKDFQQANDLKDDGVVCEDTKKALGISGTTGPQPPSRGSGGASWRDDTNLLARTIHAEARGEPYIGQVAVGAVILNRTRHAEFPKTISGVIYQPWAFTAVHDGQINLSPSSTAYRAAQDAISGWDPSGGAVYYYNPRTATSRWIFNRPRIKTIGSHVFAR